MVQQKISPAKIYLILAIVVSIGGVLGIILAMGKIRENNPPIVASPTISPVNTVNPVSGNELSFETIIKGANSNQKDAKNFVIKSQSEWMPVLQKTDAELPAPIDFSNDMLIAVFQGEKTTGGYDIEISKIIEKENVIEVSVIETFPDSECVVTNVFTSPFHIVKVQTYEKEVIFKTITITTNCLPSAIY